MDDDNSTESTLAHTWVLVVGALFGFLTLIFFMGLIVLGVLQREVPCDNVYLVSATLSLGAALSAAFLGGNASARGSIPFLHDSPLTMGASGGVAVLVIMLVLTSNLFARENCEPAVTVSCPTGFQEHVIDQLRFGFCYPRQGWEVDTGAITLNAADVYLRKSTNRDVGVHFHVALIPPGWAGRPEDYTTQVMRAWSQIDADIKQVKTFIGGRDAYQFSLHVKDRKGRARPTEVTHIYLDSERLLETLLTWFDETPSNVLDQMKRVRSSLTFARY